MDVLRVIILKEASQMKDKYQINIIRYHLYVKTLKNIQINLFKKNKTDRCRKQSYCDQSRRRREG